MERTKPALADRIKVLPWVADGVSGSEQDAAQMLIDAANHYPGTFTTLVEMPWVGDDDLTAAETNAIYGIRWGAKSAPALSDRMLESPWVQDAITKAEGEFIKWLYLLARDDEVVAVSLVQTNWVEDGIDETEYKFLGSLRYFTNGSPAIGRSLISAEWVRDGIAERDLAVVHELERLKDGDEQYGWEIIGRILVSEWMQDGLTKDDLVALELLERMAREQERTVLKLVDMPFLETLEAEDLMALSAIKWMERRGDGHMEALRESRIFKDGITDDLTTLVRAAGTIRDADVLARWLVPGYASVEVYTGQTTLTPDLRISIFRDRGVSGRRETMPEIVRVAEQLEGLMQVPLPNPRLVFVISDQAPSKSSRGISQGKRYDFAHGLRGDPGATRTICFSVRFEQGYASVGGDPRARARLLRERVEVLAESYSGEDL